MLFLYDFSVLTTDVLICRAASWFRSNVRLSRRRGGADGMFVVADAGPARQSQPQQVVEHSRVGIGHLHYLHPA